MTKKNKPGQHFLLKASSRNLSLKEIYKGGDEKAYEVFKKLRWPETDGDPVCPRCGSLDYYHIKTRKKFKCAACYKQFSVTSGTIFDSRKMSFCDLLAGICIVANSVKGLSSLQLSRDMDVQYKTAWVFAHKLRTALAVETENMILDGEVEIDGAYFGGHVRPKNKRVDRVDRRKWQNQSDDRRSVIGLRERGGRTLAFVRKYESEGVEIVKKRVAFDTVLFADEARHWDNLELHFDVVGRINHEQAYSLLDGTHTNNIESFWSRAKRMVGGQHHHVSPKYLHHYINQAAWNEDHRRRSNCDNTYAMLGSALAHRISPEFKAYWQRRASDRPSTAR
ncbi:IS1595 family transposase [Agrobacterium vitis]